MGIEENNYDPTPYLRSRDLRIDFIEEEEGDASDGVGVDEAGTSSAQEVRVLAPDPACTHPEAAPSAPQPALPSAEGPSSSAAGAAPFK